MRPTVEKNQGASPESLEELRQACPSLPESYFAFLAETNGAEGDLGVEPGWFVVWPAEEARVASHEYQLPEHLPGFFAFGGNGGGELFVLPVGADTARQPVYMVPAIGMAQEHLVEVAPSFADFTASCGQVLRKNS